MAVELRGQGALALHFPAEMKGAAPGAILPAMNHVASTALGMREGDSEDGHKNDSKDSKQAGKGEAGRAKVGAKLWSWDRLRLGLPALVGKEGFSSK